ncbi:hypothetical protein AMECASPLE_009752 [Ameca splendens]|uniref:Uncharacterized protein n=1 Tax=Ameca splendens TaxID=208324 RepID=A0ABV0Z020_9TELE
MSCLRTLSRREGLSEAPRTAFRSPDKLLTFLPSPAATLPSSLIFCRIWPTKLHSSHSLQSFLLSVDLRSSENSPPHDG